MKGLGTGVTALAVVAMASSAQAVVVDGSSAGDGYGAALAVQTVQTQFGDSGGAGTGGGELDAAYAQISGGRLFIMLTGNQEGNFNKLDIFIDSVAGGENALSGTPDYDFNPGGGWISSNLVGLTFDTGFAADYHLFGRSSGSAYEVDFIDRQGGAAALVPGSAGSAATVLDIGSGSVLAGSLGPNASGTSLTQNLDFGFNNSNTAGVLGGTAAANAAAAAAVTTGMEFSIALADIGNPGIGDTIKIAALYNNGDHNFLSNQTLGGLPGGTGNLGGNGAGGFTGDLSGVNLNNFAGNQYFSIVVPEPASMALLGLGGLAMLRRRA